MFSEKIPDRGWIPLYTLYKVGKIPTAVKLQKLIFLIQTEGHVDGYRFFKNHYGPFSNELDVDIQSFSESLDLMQMKSVDGSVYPYYLYTSNPKGNALVKEVVEPKIPRETLKRVDEVIARYKDKNYKELQEYVYRKYIINDQTFEEVYPSLSDNLVSLCSLWEKWYREDCPVAFSVLAVVEYCSRILSKLTVKKDPVLRGVCISSISEMTTKILDLTSSWKVSDNCPLSFKSLFSEISDQINFLDHYCGKHEILPNILEIDFSDFMNEEELGRLENELSKTRPSELMY